MQTVNYDSLSDGYAMHRIPDPRFAEAIGARLDGADSVLNVGAGMGSYEPGTGNLVAVDASFGMLAKRTSDRPAVQALAEALPLASESFDACMAILTIHHWQEQEAGLHELNRVAKHKVVLLTWVGFPSGFWLADYIPEVGTIDEHLFPSLDELKSILGPLQVETVPIPRDCTDGMLCAYWARPERYLDRSVRRAISTFSRLPEPVEGLQRLASDLESGRWHDLYGECLERSSMDYGYRLVVAEKSVA